MKTPTLATVKDACAIMSDGRYVLVFGKSFWIFRKDGSFVAKHKTIRNAYKAVFLPDNTILVDGSGDGQYHYISLDSGAILWSSIQKGRRTMSATRFAVSPDGCIIYDVCYVGFNAVQIDRIIPQEQKHDYYKTVSALRTTDAIYCDQEGNLCLLQSHVDFDDVTKISLCRQYGILSINIANDILYSEWKKRWESTDTIGRTVCGCDGRYILFENFDVLDIETQSTFTLLQDKSFRIPGRFSFDYVYDRDRKLLTVSYLGVKLNMVLDCVSKNVIAQYPRATDSVGYMGCLVHDSFWIGTPEGIVIKDFPQQASNI